MQPKAASLIDSHLCENDGLKNVPFRTDPSFADVDGHVQRGISQLVAVSIPQVLDTACKGTILMLLYGYSLPVELPKYYLHLQ
jgi:hypothetical protein